MKKLVLVLSVVFVTMSSFNTVSVENEEYAASCFEQAHWYGQWWRSVTGGSALDALDVINTYYDNCVAANAPVQHNI